ncbi:MAG TPA: chemotaxis protein CheC, partial [Methanocella sp.]|nr:chemotaxis protein CheC [Methanocella sp.]
IYFQLIDGDSHNDGHIYLLFPENSAFSISDMLMCNELGTTKAITDIEKSALMEVGNVLISSFGDASAELLGITMLPSTPVYKNDMARNLISEIVTDLSKTTRDAILFKTALTNESSNVSGYLLLLPEPQTLDNMLRLLGAKANG